LQLSAVGSIQIVCKTRLKITSVITRVHKSISIRTQGSKSQCLLLRGKLELNCRPSKSMQYCMHACMPAYDRNTACKLFCKAGGQGWQAKLPGKSAGQVCRASLPGKSAGQVCRASLPGKFAGQVCRSSLPGKTAVKTAGQGCRARLPGKAAGQGCRARLPGKAAGLGCRARLTGKAAGQGCMAMVEYAESMVKLVENAVF
jgi:hypothetical protein